MNATAYDWTVSFRALYDKALDLYRSGNTDLTTYFSEQETEFLSSIGMRSINVFDYAEDMAKYGEPSWDTALLIAAVRRDYFLHHQHGVTSVKVTEAEELPAKTDELEGIAWLPRIIRKAQCFLEGGLCHDIMYGCGGDRRFLKEHDLHPADFLRIVWAADGDPSKVLAKIRKPSR
jgi:hypothetical protein